MTIAFYFAQEAILAVIWFIHTMAITEGTPWLTQQEAIAYCKVSEDTLLRWIKADYLQAGIHYGGSGKLRRFDRDMLDAAIRFQDDPESHNLVIQAKLKSLRDQQRYRRSA